MDAAGKVQNMVSFKSQIKDFCRRRSIRVSKYRVIKEVGRGHAPTYSAIVSIGRVTYFGSKKSTRKEAEQSAATVAMMDILYSTRQDEELKRLEKELEVTTAKNKLLEERLKKELEDTTAKNKLLEERCSKLHQELNAVRNQYFALMIEFKNAAVEKVGEITPKA